MIPHHYGDESDDVYCMRPALSARCEPEMLNEARGYRMEQPEAPAPPRAYERFAGFGPPPPPDNIMDMDIDWEIMFPDVFDFPGLDLPNLDEL